MLSIPITVKDLEGKSYIEIMDALKDYIEHPEGIHYDEFVGYLYNLFKLFEFSPSTEQLYALLVSRTQPTLIDACPGSGKTTLTQILTIIDEFIYNIDPERICCVTFSRKASIDMVRRHKFLKSKVNVPTEVEVSTIHALCRKYIKQYYTECGLRNFYDSPTLSTIMEEEQSFQMFYSLYKTVIKDGNLNNAKDMYACNSYGISCDLTDEQVRQTPHFLDLRVPWAKYDSIVGAYGVSKKASGKLDFDDLQIVFLQLLEKNPNVRRKIQAEWDRWVIDEYQDTSIIQKGIIKLIVGNPKLLVAVGDGDQTIYSWRGADPYGCVQFKDLFSNALVTTLTINHRCPTEIVDKASALINHNKIRNYKAMVSPKEGGVFRTIPCKSNHEACKQIASDLIAWRDAGGKRENLKEFAVLFRSNYQPTALIDMLLKHDIPMNITSGILPYRDRIVTDFYNIVSLAQEPNAEYYIPHLYKIFGSVRKTSINAILAQVREGRELKNVRVQGVSGNWYAKEWEEFEELITLANSRRTPVKELASKFLPMYYKAYYDSLADFLGIEEAHTALISSYLLEQPKDMTFNTFLNTIQEYNKKLEMYKKLGGGVYVSTLHGVKGLEFNKVYMLGIDNNFPSETRILHMNMKDAKEFIEEERRLLYVGLTRASQSCNVFYDKMSPSRFLPEIIPIEEKEQLTSEEGKGQIAKKDDRVIQEVGLQSEIHPKEEDIRVELFLHSQYVDLDKELSNLFPKKEPKLAPLKKNQPDFREGEEDWRILEHLPFDALDLTPLQDSPQHIEGLEVDVSIQEEELETLTLDFPQEYLDVLKDIN